MAQDAGVFPGCSSASEARKWTCEHCTYENWSTSTLCTMCRGVKKPPVPAKVLIGKAATSSVAGGAVSVGSPRAISPPHALHALPDLACPQIVCDQQQLQQSGCGKWACPTCTYLNWPRAIKCVQCLTPRRRLVVNNGNGGYVALTSRNSPVSPRASPPASSSCSPPPAPTSPTAMASLTHCMGAVSVAEVNNNNNKRLDSSSSSTTPTLSPKEAPRRLGSANSSKWACSSCTYENWPRSMACVICGTKAPGAAQSSQSSVGYNRETPSPSNMAGSVILPQRSTSCEPERALSPHCIVEECSSSSSTLTSNNFDYERRMRQLRRRMREADWTWLTACMGVVEGDVTPVEAYLSGGGDPTRKLTNPEVALLNRGTMYEAGHTLVHLAIRFHREDMLATLLSRIESGSASSGTKCVPAYVAPDLAGAIRRHASMALRQKKGQFPCYYFVEWATYTLPPEIDDLPPATQEQLYSELMDRDAHKELEDANSGGDGAVINWSAELSVRLGSRLYALWNRSAGDCLLDSALQATWGVFDRDNTLRKAMADSLHEAGHVFFPRWREWEIQQALELDFSLHESQLSGDWAGILRLAAQPGASLEQIHVFCLAHVLRRPIIVYGVKYVKSWRGENLGYARFEGVYLPLLWDSSFCSRSPIALGYTRGHFCALVPPEPSVASSAVHSGAGASSSSHDGKSTFLPLVTSDLKTLPVHFLSESELGKEEVLLRQFLDVGVTESGLLVAEQRVAKPPLLVAQMTEEWLNHYRKLAQSSTAPFSTRTNRPQSATSGVVVLGGAGQQQQHQQQQQLAAHVASPAQQTLLEAPGAGPASCESNSSSSASLAAASDLGGGGTSSREKSLCNEGFSSDGDSEEE